MGYEKISTGYYLVWHDCKRIGYALRIGHRPVWMAISLAGKDCGIFKTRTEAAEGLRKEREG